MIAPLLLLAAALLGHADDGISPIPPPPAYSEVDQIRAYLGQRLFEDPRLSKRNTISCRSCHDTSGGGADNRTVTVGVDQRVVTTNTPTVFNSSLNFRQFWDGRERTLEKQASTPIHNPSEMDSNWNEIILKIRQDRRYLRLFGRAYSGVISGETITGAIALYERTLVTPNSRFDRFLGGDRRALAADELKGFEKFKALGCISCHQGANVGGNMFQLMGVAKNYFADRGKLTKADLGLYNVTKKPADRHYFKVPSLRFAVHTPPYFHDGSASTLEEAIVIMGRYQLGRELSAEETRLIVRFLETLPGDRPRRLAPPKGFE